MTRLLDAVAAGDRQAAGQLLPLVYEQLRKLAAARMAAESPGHTLDATALVHEAYVRLVGGDRDLEWNGRGHFFAAAAEAMRRILVESARRKGRLRHGGGRVRIDLDQVAPAESDVDERILAVDEALDVLALEDLAAATVVKLRFFVGLSAEDAAAALGVSLSTANRHWAYARAWLFQRLGNTNQRAD